MRPVALIPARGGSKRIPLKNVRPFLGTPILTRVIRTLAHSNAFDAIVVSTDHPAIRATAEEAGALVPFARSEHTAGDNATLHDVVVEALEQMPAYLRRPHLMCMLPTAVLVTPDTIRSAINQFHSGEHDSMMSVQRYPHPIERALRVTEQGHLQRHTLDSARMRTQDPEPAFHDAGQFYLVRTDDVPNRTTLMGVACLPFELGPFDAQDIDSPTDWQLAEFKFTWRVHNHAT